jgi:hypothetical protein
MSTSILNSMSRVFDFVEKWVAETEQKHAARGGKWKENLRKPKKGARWRDILKQDFGQLNEDRLYGKLAPMKPAL